MNLVKNIFEPVVIKVSVSHSVLSPIGNVMTLFLTSRGLFAGKLCYVSLDS